MASKSDAIPFRADAVEGIHTAMVSPAATARIHHHLVRQTHPATARSSAIAFLLVEPTHLVPAKFAQTACELVHKRFALP
jgi:hypothetical protein